MLKIYGSVRSRASRTLWMAFELGIPYEHADYNPRSPETRTPAYLGVNPNGSVPAIDDDGFILWESNAIVRYLAQRHGDGALPRVAGALTFDPCPARAASARHIKE